MAKVDTWCFPVHSRKCSSLSRKGDLEMGFRLTIWFLTLQ